MTTIKDLCWDSITIQGTVKVTTFDFDKGEENVVWEGYGEYIDTPWACSDDDEFPWLDYNITFIYPDPKEKDVLHIEVACGEDL